VGTEPTASRDTVQDALLVHGTLAKLPSHNPKRVPQVLVGGGGAMVVLVVVVVVVLVAVVLVLVLLLMAGAGCDVISLRSISLLSPLPGGGHKVTWRWTLGDLEVGTRRPGGGQRMTWRSNWKGTKWRVLVCIPFCLFVSLSLSLSLSLFSLSLVCAAIRAVVDPDLTVRQGCLCHGTNLFYWDHPIRAKS
jgi:hypothetical protein